MLWVGANHFDRSQQQVRRLKTALVTVRPVLRRTSVIQYQCRQSGSILPIKHWSHLVSSPGFFQHFQVVFFQQVVIRSPEVFFSNISSAGFWSIRGTYAQVL